MTTDSSEPNGAAIDLQQLIAELDRELAEDPTNVLAHDQRGNAYFQLQEYQRAISDYTRALELDPECAAAYVHRGQAFVALGYHQWAAADLSRAEELGRHHQQLVPPQKPVAPRLSRTLNSAASFSGRRVGPGSKIGIVNALLYFPMILVAECGLFYLFSPLVNSWVVGALLIIAPAFLIASIVVFIRRRHHLARLTWKQRIWPGIQYTFVAAWLFYAIVYELPNTFSVPNTLSIVLLGCLVMSYGIALAALALY